MAAEDPSVWRQLTEIVWVPLAALISAIWGMLHNRINRIEKVSDNAEKIAMNAVQKEECSAKVQSIEMRLANTLPNAVFQAHLQDLKEYRQTREAMDRQIFDKLDSLKDLIIERMPR